MTLAIEDCMCPICMCIMVEPVTMPCKHTLCYPCFKQNVEEASLACPLCRVRISVWARRSSKNGTLVNKKLWAQIQELFPDQVEKRLKGLDDSIEEPVFQPVISIAKPGEIRKEYEEQLKRLEAQREEERRKEQEASEALIRELEAEEARRRELEIRDQELAREISQEVNQGDRDDDSVLVISDDAVRRQTRSVSTTSSCSGNSSRPGSTIDSLLRKMREAEKLKAADEASRKAASPQSNSCHSPMERLSKHQGARENYSSPFPFECYTPTEKPSLQEKGRELVSRDLSSAGLSSRSYTTGSEVGNFLDNDDEDLPSKYVSLGLPSLDTTIENIGDRDGEMFDKDSVEVVERCRSSESMDSISQEISHFRPIRACPLTPPRKLASGKVVETPLIRTTPRNLNKTEFGSPVRTLSDLEASSPIMQRRLSELEEERKSNVNKFSKSTCTEVKNTEKSKTVTNDCDKNHKSTQKNPCRDHADFTMRISEEKDLEGGEKKEHSPLSKHKKLQVNEEKKSDANKFRLKKLVIPLEPTFDDEDFDIPPMKENNPKSINSDTMVIARNLSPVVTKSKSEQNASARKKSRKTSTTSKPGFGGPQRTITDWIRKSVDCTGKNVFQIEAGGRDDVDGEPVHKRMHEEADRVTQSGDGPTKKRKKQHEVVKSYPKRVRKPYNPDPMWTSVSHFGNSVSDVDVDECSRDSIALSAVLAEENDDFSEALKSKPKKRASNSVREEKSKKARRLKEKTTASSRLKKTSAKSKLQAVHHPRGKKMMFNFCSETNIKLVKDAIRNSQHVEEEADFRVSEGNEVDKRTQEMMDRKLAEELARQYEMEAKKGIQFFKLKGTSEEYNFRRKPKLSF